MMEKALVIMVFMYASGFALLSAQYVFADVFGITLTSPVTGQPIKSNIITYINLNNINSIEGNVTSTTRSSVVTNINSFLGMVWELILLLTGTYIFNILQLLGVPSIAIVGFVGIYFFLLIRAYFGYIRGISRNLLYAKLFQHDSKNNTVLCLGHSMKNILGVAFVKYGKKESYKINDVISFIGNNNVKYCHRIIKIDDRVFTTQGDNIPTQDYETNVPISNIEGKVFWSYPKWN